MFEDRERMKELLGELKIEEIIEQKIDPIERMLQNKKILVTSKAHPLFDTQYHRPTAQEFFKNIGVDFVFFDNDNLVYNMLNSKPSESSNEYAGIIFDGDYYPGVGKDLWRNFYYHATRAAEKIGIPYLLFLNMFADSETGGSYYSRVFSDEVAMTERIRFFGNRDEIFPSKKKPEAWEGAFELLKQIMLDPNFFWQRDYKRMKGLPFSDFQLDRLIKEKEKRMRNYNNV